MGRSRFFQNHLAQMNFSHPSDHPSCFPCRFCLLHCLFTALGFALLLGPLTACRTPAPSTKLPPADYSLSQGGERSVEQTLHKFFDRPGAPLTVKPVSIEGDIAVAGWMQNGTGGRTLLKRHHGLWEIALCGDAGLIEPASLQKAGLSYSSAVGLAYKIKSAETELTDQEKAQINSFRGVVHIGAGQPHPSPQ